MFFLPLALVTWFAAIWAIDWRRGRELVVYGLFGALISEVENELGYLLGLWEYRDIGPLADHHAVSMLISLSPAPLFAIGFAQALKPGQPLPWLRIAGTTSVAMVPEILALYTGHIEYGKWWSTSTSTVAYLPTWLAIWWLHRWLSG